MSDSSSSLNPPSSTSVPKTLTNDPKRTGFDPTLAWYENLFRACTGRMTPEGIVHYRESRYIANEARDCARCEEYRDWMFKFSPIVRFMQQKIGMLHGELDERNIICRRCPTRMTDDGSVHRIGGGFSPDHGILICANEVRNKKHMEDTLAHEMVHAWDHLRWKMDAENNLRHAACTEIRASMLSGECRWTREFFTRGNWSLSAQFQNCVRDRAIQSVMARARCKDKAQASKVVNEVWDSCFSDTRPFDEVYR
ncbi:Mitochondrial inner membrane protease atp23 [Ceratocystis pirilliformis]|uniref:Mitochondrial inner membrane protease ATP23 n=1 Tax=Ceratocystis pirilliformis TaxID=259994 RepID=A0ABR3ZK85_9PEZI